MDHAQKTQHLNDSNIPAPGTSPAEAKPLDAPVRRHPSTVRQYGEIARQMERSAARAKYPYSTNEDGFLDTVQCSATEILMEFEQWAPNKQRRSYDTYRAALLWAFHQGTFSDRPDARECYHKLSQMKSDKPIRGKTNRDPRRPISLPKKDLQKIIDELLTHNKKNDLGVMTQNWLLAGIATGLRPSEWEFAELIRTPNASGEIDYSVKVKNSKRKAAIPVSMQMDVARKEFPLEEINTVFDAEELGASIIYTETPERRYIPIESKDSVWVGAHLRSIREHLESGTPFEKFYDKCRRCLDRACQYAFKGKKIYSLYVTRHQFAANAKGKYTREEVAVLMGHSDIASANKYYAAKRYGHRGKGQGQQDKNTQAQSYFEPTVEGEGSGEGGGGPSEGYGRGA